jgi:hypothetical protein
MEKTSTGEQAKLSTRGQPKSSMANKAGSRISQETWRKKERRERKIEKD